MKKIILVSLLVIIACATTARLLLAQLPTTRILVWDPNPPEDQVTTYVVTVNGAVANVPAPTTEYQFPITQTGPLNLSVRACNQWGCSSDTQLNLIVSVPGQSKNLRIR